MAHNVDHEAFRTLSNVAERALALLKAELRVFVMQNKQFALKVGVGAGLALVGAVLGQLSLMLIAVTPLLIGVRPWWAIASAIALSAVPSALCLWAARRSFRAATLRTPASNGVERAVAGDRKSSYPPAADRHPAPPSIRAGA